MPVGRSRGKDRPVNWQPHVLFYRQFPTPRTALREWEGGRGRGGGGAWDGRPRPRVAPGG